MSDGYTREGFLRLLRERLAAAHLAGRDGDGFPASSLMLMEHYLDQLLTAESNKVLALAEELAKAERDLAIAESTFDRIGRQSRRNEVNEARAALVSALGAQEAQHAYSLVFIYPGEDVQVVGATDRADIIAKLREDVSDGGEPSKIEGIADQLLSDGVWHDEGGRIELRAHGVRPSSGD